MKSDHSLHDYGMISNNLVEIASFSYPYEAHIARASLDAADIPVFITDEHTINMQWLYSNALGGVRLLVPKHYEIEARALITKDFSENLNDELPTESASCPHCGSNDIQPYTIGKRAAFFIFLLLGFPLFFYKHGLKCNNCGNFTKT